MGRIGSAMRLNTISLQVTEIAAVVTCKYDYKAAGVVDLGTISIRRCSGRGVTADSTQNDLRLLTVATWLLVSVGKVELQNCNCRDGSEVMLYLQTC